MGVKVVPEANVAAVGSTRVADPESAPRGRRKSMAASFAGAIEGLRTSRQSRRTSQMLVEIVSGISKAPDEMVLMGLRPVAHRDAVLAECKEQIASRSKWHNAADVLRRFWLYFLLENLYAVIPLLLALVPVVAGGALANELITSLPMTAGKYGDFRDLGDGGDPARGPRGEV